MFNWYKDWGGYLGLGLGKGREIGMGGLNREKGRGKWGMEYGEG